MFSEVPSAARDFGVCAFLVLIPASARAQQMVMPTDASGWHVMQDAVVVGMFNHQGGPRGGDEFKVPNWWMGMFGRRIKSSHLTLNTMLSLDPATVGKKGYRELFQVGETYGGQPLIDRQHPHDFFMQVAAVWRVPIGAGTGFTLAGAPVGEPALGPVAFMHRASTGENPLAPLSHHTFDSTHIAFGVVTAALDRGPLMFEASVFNGREPDEHRWDFDFGRLDSFSGRVWCRPSDEWEFQVSSARLTEPEALEPGDIIRTTGSASWLNRTGEDFTAVTVAVGHNGKDHGDQSSLLGEAAHRVGRTAIYGRFEAHQVETSKLSSLMPPDQIDSIWAFTVGGLRDVLRWRGVQGGVGAGLTLYAAAKALEFTHGERPVSFQLFFRLRPVAGVMGRMWNMHMVKPMSPADPTHKH